MINEAILAGRLVGRVEVGKTKNGYDFASGKIELDEPRPDGTRWKTTVPIAGFGKEGTKLAALHPGDLLLVKGRVGWIASDGLCITLRTVEQLRFEDSGQDDAA